MSKYMTIFVDEAYNELDREEGLLSITLYKGMKVSLENSLTGHFVLQWQMHRGHPVYGTVLMIVLKEDKWHRADYLKV